MKAKVIFCSILIHLAFINVYAQITLIKHDIYSISNYYVVGNILFFVASDSAHGTELWKSEGTETGTFLVKDIQIGSKGSNPNRFINIDGTLFFTADDSIHGIELWKTDGTEAGTLLVNDLLVGSKGSNPAIVYIEGGTIFFTADDSIHGIELWKTDGTEAGTLLVKDIQVGLKGSNPAFAYYEGGTIFFTADDSVHGRELWKTDGTEIGTFLVKDIQIGTNGSSPSYYRNISETIFFTADDGVHGKELWKTDGTETGTILVKDIQSGSIGSNPYNLFNFNNILFFSTDDGIYGRELWKSDGTSAGTILVKDLVLSSTSSNLNNFGIINGTLYFFYRNSSITYLCESDGSEDGTILKFGGYSMGSIVYTENNLFFCRHLSSAFDWMWNMFSQNGDLGVVEFNNHISLNGTFFFNGYKTFGGTGLFMKSDGTLKGTSVVKEKVYEPELFTKTDSTLFFTADDSIHGRELWSSDGTDAGTRMIYDLTPGKESTSFGYQLKQFGDYLFFYAKNDTCQGLWRYSIINKAPGNQAQDVQFSNITANQVDISWVNGDGNFRAVFMRPEDKGFAFPDDYMTYNADTTFSWGKQIANSGWYCIYNGSGNKVSVSGLSPETTYRVMVCEYNGTSGFERYNCSDSSGNPNSFLTLLNTRIENQQLTNVSIYPNPTHNKVYISFSRSFEGASYGVFNISGTQLLNKKVYNSNTEIDFSLFPDGIYIVKLISCDSIIEQLIIKE